MKDIRKKRLESSIHREISDLIMKQRQKDDRIGLVSVTEIKLAPDFSRLEVYISLFGASAENRETWLALNEHAKHIQSLLGRNLRLRQTPHLIFKMDDRIKEGDRILDLIDS